MTRFFKLLILLAAFALASPTGAQDQLIIFNRSNSAGAGKTFHEKYLPKIAALAKERNVELKVLAPRDGAPPEVTITPSIFFQNHKGRSLYVGRYSYVDKIGHFMRTARAIPLKTAANVKEKEPAYLTGRSLVVAPLKITELKGEFPESVSRYDFYSKAYPAIAMNFEKLSMQEKTEMGASDRAFYMDFYPMQNANGELEIELALYSQFSCIEPV